MPSGAFVARRNGRIFVTGNSGFPKSLDISKQLDKRAGAEREVVGFRPSHYPDSDCWGTPNKNDDGAIHNSSSLKLGIRGNAVNGTRPYTAPATDAARTWHGYGTALKPAWEPIILAMKPLDGTYAHNALVHGVAGLAIDKCRVPIDGEAGVWGAKQNAQPGNSGHTMNDGWQSGYRTQQHPSGRWPANLVLDEGAAEMLDEMSGELQSNSGNLTFSNRKQGVAFGKYNPAPTSGITDTGGASRFFYCAKSSRAERELGLGAMPATNVNDGRQTPIDNPYQRGETLRKNTHPTVKPLELMRWLCRLTATPTGGTVLDPFMGSGSTGMAAVLEDRNFVGIELDEGYYAIAERRIAEAQAQPALLEEVARG